MNIPRAEEAERQVAGGVISNPRHGCGFEIITDPAAFYSPALARVFGLRQALADVPFVRARIAFAASRSGLDHVEAAQLVAETVLLHDFRPFARRVVEAARARRVMAAAGEVYNRLGCGATLDDIAPWLADLAAVA